MLLLSVDFAHRREVLQQQPVDEDIPAADLSQKYQLGAMVQESM
jgi:hypothetical protein